MAEKSIEELKQDFRIKIQPYKQGVADEFLKRQNGYIEPTIVTGLSEDQKQIAQRLLNLQLEKGSFSKKDMLDEDYEKIKIFASSKGLSFKQAVSCFLTNDRYMSPDEVEIQNICNLVEDSFQVYEKFYDKLGVFPVNALSESSRNYLSNKKVPLGLVDKLTTFFEEYVPDMAKLNIVTKSYKAVPRYKYQYNDDIARQLAGDLIAAYGDEKGLVDDVFSKTAESDLNQLIKIISERGISFDNFASKYGVKYTRCYMLDAEPAILEMIKHYNSVYGTYQGITEKDPYLRQKIDTLEQHNMSVNLSEFLIKHNISHDVFDNGQTLPASEFQRRITNLTSNLKVLYDDGVIEESFSIKQPELYDSALKLAMRKGMTMDDFFESIGFKRASNSSNPGYLSQIILTERDLYHYGFLSSGTLDELSKFIQQYKVSLAEVENNRFNYQRLVADKNDYLKSYKYQTPQKGE